MTWFSSHGNVHWIIADGKTLDEIVEQAIEIINGFLYNEEQQ